MRADNFFVYCTDFGYEVFETLNEALDAANERTQEYLDDTWNEEVTSVCVGRITHRAKMCDQVYPVGEIDEDGLDEAGDYWDPDWGYKCNYKMMPSVPDVAALLDALTPQILDWVRCGLAANGRLRDGDHPALAKLRAAIASCRRDQEGNL